MQNETERHAEAGPQQELKAEAGPQQIAAEPHRAKSQGQGSVQKPNSIAAVLAGFIPGSDEASRNDNQL